MRLKIVRLPSKLILKLNRRIYYTGLAKAITEREGNVLVSLR